MEDMDQHGTVVRMGEDISSVRLWAFRRSDHKSVEVDLIWLGGLPPSHTNTNKWMEDYLSVGCTRDTSIASAAASLRSAAVVGLGSIPRS